jgi:glycosyltransferase involved in cell wall biosynthesis
MIDYVNSMVESCRPDIIWQRSYRLHSAGLLASERFGIPYIHEWKDHLIPYSISLYHRRAINLEKCKNCEAKYIVVESERLKEDLKREGVKKDKILVAHNAVHPEEFNIDVKKSQEYRREIGVGDDEVLVGYLGSYAFYHDAARLVMAADILRRYKDITIKVIMVGVGKEYTEAYQLAKEKNLLDSMVIMRPAVPAETVPKVLSALDIAVLPGCTDIICPVKVQEYMAMELATVVPDYACNREVITDGQTGMLFEPKNERSLAEKLSLLAKDHKMRDTLGKNAREEVIKRFTWEKTWGKALEDIMRCITTGL